MKGFIEVRITTGWNEFFSQTAKVLLNINNIKSVGATYWDSIELFYPIDLKLKDFEGKDYETQAYVIEVDETYEEIKQKIKEAQGE